MLSTCVNRVAFGYCPLLLKSTSGSVLRKVTIVTSAAAAGNTLLKSVETTSSNDTARQTTFKGQALPRWGGLLLPSGNKYTIKLDENCKAERLVLQSHIEEAQHLLYRVYVEECKWRFAVDNPTGFKIVVKNGKKCLVDKFDDTAIWIGAFYFNEIVSLIRILSREGNLPLDLEGYSASKKPEIQAKLQLGNLVECQRCVTDIKYRNRGLNCLTIAVAGKMLLSQQVCVITTSPAPFFSTKGQVLDERFDYGDGIYTQCIFYDRMDLIGLAKSVSSKIAMLPRNLGELNLDKKRGSLKSL